METRWASAPEKVLLKLSGEAIGSSSPEETIDEDVVDRIASEVAALKREFKIAIGIVVGGGNIWRGARGKSKGMDKTIADQMGMMATMINALAFKAALERHGVNTRAMSAIRIEQVMEPHIAPRAVRHLQKDRVVVFAGGLGEIDFTTDTAAAQRALEIDADVLLVAKHGGVQGIYDKDPNKHNNAVLLPQLTFDEAWERRLTVMDRTAFTKCRDNDMKMVVYDGGQPGNLRAVIVGELVGTLVTN
jgi:uridylate kinase